MTASNLTGNGSEAAILSMLHVLPEIATQSLPELSQTACDALAARNVPLLLVIAGIAQTQFEHRVSASPNRPRAAAENDGWSALAWGAGVAALYLSKGL